jgi:hypothetical protein
MSDLNVIVVDAHDAVATVGRVLSIWNICLRYYGVNNYSMSRRTSGRRTKRERGGEANGQGRNGRAA